MKIIKTKFKDLFVVKQFKNKDARGYLRESYKEKILRKKFIFEYFTHSKKNVLRGFHIQLKYPQSKYINVMKGKILDYVLDLRPKSKTFGKSFKIILSETNSLGLFIPKGFAHAYYSYQKENIISYKLDNYYYPKYQDGILWNDKSLNLKWPNKNPIVSNKDKKLKSFNHFLNNRYK